ncbi:hypothetical protein Taro_000139, partial [Colocasia esculenta]|nr:hypothetical protein [Colocasia esculenta]
MVLLTWLLSVSRGDTWLFLLDLVEVWDVGACVVRLWSHVVAPVFCELLCLSGCVPRVASALCLTPLVLRESCWARPWLWFVAFTLFRCFIVLCVPAALDGKGMVISIEPCSRGSPPYSLQVGTRSRRSLLPDSGGGSSDLWVAAQPSAVPGGGPGGRVVTVVSEGPGVSYRRVLLLLLGARAASVVAVFARAVVGFVLGLCVRMGVSRRLREPACGVAFTSAWLLPVDPEEGSCLAGSPLVVWSCVSLLDVCWPCVPVRCCALCSTQSTSLLKLSRCFVYHVALLVEHCDTCLWLLPALCWLFVNSGELFLEFFSVGSGGGEVFPRT